MAYDIQTLISRIDERLAALNMSDRKASLDATGQPDAIRYIKKRGAWPSAVRLARLAVTLNATPDYLVGRDDVNAWEPAERLIVDSKDGERRLVEALDQLYNYTDSRGARPSEQPDAHEDGLIPLFHSSFVGFQVFKGAGGEEIDVQMASVDGAVVQHHFKKPDECKYEPFALINPTDGMEPAVKSGDLLFIDRQKQPVRGDICIVTFSSPETEADEYLWNYLIATFARRTKTASVFLQAATNIEFEVRESTDYNVHPILSNKDLWGL